ncbi:MarR family winged helix-turn-helix transcriptional regulator [Chitinasiproducens palmae]|nr:MarR family winged helix-turn-helix transcriptional regulator [Chitinasiproducens palmae]
MTDTTRLALDAWVPYRLSFIVNHISAQLHAVCSERFGISAAAWRVMAHLGDAATLLSAKEVAQRAAMDSVSVTRALNQLEDLGLLIRRIDTDDRRRVTLRLSKKGNMVYQEIIPVALAAERDLLAGLSEAERETLAALTQRLWRNVEKGN